MTPDPGLLASVVGAVLVQLSDLMNNLPPELRELIEAAPPLRSPEGAAIYGSGGLMGIGGILKIVGRFRSSSASTGTASASTAGGTVVTTAKGGTPPSIKDDETAFTLPSILPLSKGIRKVSHNEIHALEIGAVVGFLTVWLYSVGRRNVAAGITIAFVAGALGFERYKSKAVATVRMEPWYAFVSFAVGGGVAYYVFMA